MAFRENSHPDCIGWAAQRGGGAFVFGAEGWGAVEGAIGDAFCPYRGRVLEWVRVLRWVQRFKGLVHAPATGRTVLEHIQRAV